MTPLELEVGWSPSAFRRPDGRHDVLRAAFVVQLVALSTGIGAGEIVAPTRHCADAARARQLAMYLAHTVFAWPLGRVASAFGRDRTTAGYACQKVEDRREDAGFDAVLVRLERCVRAAPGEPGTLGAVKAEVLK